MWREWSWLQKAWFGIHEVLGWKSLLATTFLRLSTLGTWRSHFGTYTMVDITTYYVCFFIINNVQWNSLYWTETKNNGSGSHTTRCHSTLMSLKLIKEKEKEGSMAIFVVPWPSNPSSACSKNVGFKTKLESQGKIFMALTCSLLIWLKPSVSNSNKKIRRLKPCRTAILN